MATKQYTLLISVLLVLFLLNSVSAQASENVMIVSNVKNFVLSNKFVEKIYAYNATIIVKRDAGIDTFYGHNVNLVAHGIIGEVYIDGGEYVYISSKPGRLRGVLHSIKHVLIETYVNNESLSVKDHLLKTFFPDLKIKNVGNIILRLIVTVPFHVSGLNDEGTELILLHGGNVTNSILSGLTIFTGTNVSISNVEINSLNIALFRKENTFLIHNLRASHITLTNIDCKVVFDWRKLKLYLDESGSEIFYRSPSHFSFSLFNSRCNFSGNVHQEIYIYAEHSQILFEAHPYVMKFVENRWMYAIKVPRIILRENSKAIVPKDFIFNVDADNSSVVSYFVENVEVVGNAKIFCDNHILNSSKASKCKDLYVISEKYPPIKVLCSGCKVYTIDWIINTFRNTVFSMGLFSFSMLLALLTFYTLRYEDSEAVKKIGRVEKLIIILETLTIGCILFNEPWIASLLHSVFYAWPGILPLQIAIMVLLASLLALRFREKQLKVRFFLFGLLTMISIYTFFIILSSSLPAVISMLIFHVSIIIYYVKFSMLKYQLSHKRLTYLLFYTSLILVAIIMSRGFAEPKVLADNLIYLHYNQKHIEYFTPSNPLLYITLFLSFWFAGLLLARKFRIEWTYLTYVSIGALTVLAYHLVDIPHYPDQFVEHWDSIGVAEKMLYDPTYVVTLTFVFLGPHLPLDRFHTLLPFLLEKNYYILRVFTLGITILIITLILWIAKKVAGHKVADSFAMLFTSSPIFFGLMTLGQTADRSFWFLLLGILLLMLGRRIMAIIAFLVSHLMYLITMSVALPTTFFYLLFCRQSLRRKDLAIFIAYYVITGILIAFLLPHARRFYSGGPLAPAPSLDVSNMVKTFAIAIIMSSYALASLPFLALLQIFAFFAYSTDVVSLPSLRMELFSQIVKPSFPIPSFAVAVVFVMFILSLRHIFKRRLHPLWLWFGILSGVVMQLYALSLAVPFGPVCCWTFIDYYMLTRMMPLVILSMFVIAFGKKVKLLKIASFLLLLNIVSITILMANSIEFPIISLSSYGVSHVLYNEKAFMTHFHLVDDRVEELMYTLDDEIAMPGGVRKYEIFDAIAEGCLSLNQRICASIPEGEYSLEEDIPYDYERIFKVRIQTMVPWGNSRYFISEDATLHGKVKTLLEAEKNGVERLVIACYNVREILEKLSWLEEIPQQT